MTSSLHCHGNGKRLDDTEEKERFRIEKEAFIDKVIDFVR